MNNETGYVYLIKEREFIKTNENIYKIGKTKQDKFKRFNQYPKGSCLIYYQQVNDYHKVESKIIETLNNKYKLLKDIGKEYFEGNLIDILLDIINITNKYVDTKGNMINESKKYLSEYYNNLEKKLTPNNQLMHNLISVLNGEIKEEQYEEDLNRGNRHYINSHKALREVILKSILEEFLICKNIIKNNQLIGRNKIDKCMILSRYNSYQYIIECVKEDPYRGDILVSEYNKKNMKLAGEFLSKIGGSSLMHKFMHQNIPKIFHREIDYIWNNIGDWKC